MQVKGEPTRYAWCVEIGKMPMAMRPEGDLRLRPARVVVERLSPEIDCGRFPVKRVMGEKVEVRADVHADGQDVLAGVLLHREVGAQQWDETPLSTLGNDVWGAAFSVESLRPHEYTVEAWVDEFATWRRDLEKKSAAGVVARVDLLVGAALLEAASARTTGDDAAMLAASARLLSGAEASLADQIERALDPSLERVVSRWPDRGNAARYPRKLTVAVDRVRARTGAWYEFFPRSCSPEVGRHGTLKDAASRLEYVASMGFDVAYLPPVHPIGRIHRKGRNNAEEAGPDDPGSPWAIGAAEGGHTAIHPALGTLDDFRALLAKARTLNLEIALDLAFQCSPDHPWVKEHPSWFRHLPDGSIKTAENPPKKYEDIYPIDFESKDWRELWMALAEVVQFWLAQGVRVFRVDNPHTKPYGFWEWLISRVRSEHPDAIFLAEAFTRPRVMRELAKIGFSQSYNYFPWRNTKQELTDYLTELTRGEAREYLRPNLWANTPDILPESLQYGGRPAFQSRLVLAATLGASYGLYGPAFELCEGTALRPGSEEYLDSEKYQLRHWPIERPDSLRHFVAQVNRIRREHPALQRNDTLAFHAVDDEKLIAYSKTTDDLTEVILTVVCLDPHHRHSGWVELPLEELGLDRVRPYQAHDLLGGGRYLWSGSRNYVELDPAVIPAHIFAIRRHLRTERDFDYYL